MGTERASLCLRIAPLCFRKLVVQSGFVYSDSSTSQLYISQGSGTYVQRRGAWRTKRRMRKGQCVWSNVGCGIDFLNVSDISDR